MEDCGEAAVAAVVVVLAVGELVVLDFKDVDFLALDVRPSRCGIACAAAKTRKRFWVLYVLPGEDYFGFFD